MNNGFQKCCGVPCKYEPIVMPTKEMVCNKYICVEQPIICPVNKRIVTHYVPKPVYYHTYSQSEETVCEKPMCGGYERPYETNTPYNR